MLVLTTILLLLSGTMLGLARRSWWEVGVLTLLIWGSLRLVDTWIGSWRDQIGLPNDQRFLEMGSVGWLLVGAYVSYALAFLYSLWRLGAGTQSDR
jgi:hypothetical protein